LLTSVHRGSLTGVDLPKVYLKLDFFLFLQLRSRSPLYYMLGKGSFVPVNLGNGLVMSASTFQFDREDKGKSKKVKSEDSMLESWLFTLIVWKLRISHK